MAKKSQNYDYTAGGNSEVGKLTYQYNAAGQMIAVTDHNVNQTVRYEYDKFGRKAKVTVGENTIDYRYNRQGWLSEVQKNGETAPAKYEYDKAGRRTKLSLPNGVVTEYTYDIAGRLTGVISKNPAGKIISGTEYTLDKTGNRTGMKLTLDGSVQNVKYQFDEAYRLTAEERTDAAGGIIYKDYFAYDPLGNRMSRERYMDGKTAAKTAYTYNNANQLLTETSEGITKTYSYDKNGNTVGIKSVDASGKESGNVTMTYDWLNRQTSWSDGKNTEKQVYRGAEWKRIATLVEKADGSKDTVKYLYDGDNVLVDYSAENKPEAVYVSPMLDQYVSMTRGGQTLYYTQDGLGSVRTLTDKSGKALNRNDYFAFGEANIFAEKKIAENRYAYTGREDSKLSLSSAPMYYRWRSYNATAGRFTSMDPLLTRAGVNMYCYASNTPALFNDFYGLFPSWVKLYGSQTKYIATSNSATLEELATIAGGSEDDKVCLWPTGTTKDNGYSRGRVKMCDTYDASNLSKTASSDPTLIVSLAGDGKDASGTTLDVAIYGLHLLTGNSKTSGAAVARAVKAASGQGKTPLSMFLFSGHSNVAGSSVYAHYKGNTVTFSAGDLYSEADEKNDSDNTFQNASKQIGPPRCWFRRDGRVYALGCSSHDAVAKEWAEMVLRKGATAFGTTGYIALSYQSGVPALKFHDDSNTYSTISDVINASSWSGISGEN